MGFFNRVLSKFGFGSGRTDNKASFNGIRAMSSLAYLGDATGGHFLDIIWSKEPLDPIPVIFYFNGSGFISTNRSLGSDLCRFMAKRDYLVINGEFRDLGKNVTVEDELKDLMALMKWVIANSEKFHMDLNRVYVVGSSYGALMALWMTMLCNGTRFRREWGLDEDHPLRVSGLGLFTGMTDTESGDEYMRTIAESIRKIGKENPELAECLLPWSNHDLRILPPVFQVTSENDAALPDVVRLDKLLEINRVPHETMTFGSTIRTMRGFMEGHPSGNECTRAVSRMLTFFRDNQ